MQTGARFWLFWLILAGYLALGGLYVALTPAWQAPDEPAHYNYVRFLATRRAFPELTPDCYNQAYLNQLTSRRFPPHLPIDPVCYEYHQPPLYYLLAAPVFSLTRGALPALRGLSVLLGAGVVVLAFFIARTVLPARPAVALAAMAVVAFTPMHLTMLAAVNNDALAELLLAALLFRLVRGLTAGQPATAKTDAVTGLLLGLALVTKTTVYIAIPLTALALWWSPGRPGLRRLARRGLLVFGTALLAALPWYARNTWLYGQFDLLGLQRHDAVVVGQLRTADYLAQVGWPRYLLDFVTTTFHSFWGQFGWMAVPMDRRSYLFLALLTLLALVGLAAWLARRGPATDAPAAGHRQAIALLAAAAGLAVVVYAGYNATFVQFQGRYLFPALVPLAFFFAVGLFEVFDLPRAWPAAVTVAAVLAGQVGTGLAGAGLDKRAGLALAAVWLVLAARAWLAPRWPVDRHIWVAAFCAGLAGLAAASPFWFIVPYLNP